MRKIADIYKKYKIMPSLQRHMLRVASAAAMICEYFDEPINKESIIIACLVHDMGNIIKSKLEYFPEFNEPEGIDYWRKVQNEYLEKYGTDEHKATIQIIKELNFSEDIINIVDKVDFSFACENCDENNFANKIINYADWRVDPYEIVSYDERMNEAKKRYKNKKDFGMESEEYLKLITCGKEIEKQIFSHLKIKPEDINNESIKPYMEKLKDFEV